MSHQDKFNLTYDAADFPDWLAEPLRQDWLATPVTVRIKILRRDSELRRGVAIMKDRRMGREKYDLEGFFGLELAQQKLRTMKPGTARTAALGKIEQLKLKLARDDEEMTSQDEMLALLDHHLAGRGIEPHEWVRQCVELENTLRQDLIGGIFKIMEMRGIDPIAWIQMMKSGHRYDVALRLLDAINRPERRTLS